MTDSESDISNNIFNSQNVNTTVNAKGSNSFSCRNLMTAMYTKSERPRYTESACDSRSMYYRRETSPMSMRSIGSSVSAVDIAFAFKNGKLDKNGLKMIRDTCQKLLKQRVRKRIEKRRNIRLKFRRRSGDNSGDQASDSSVSSDDHGSVKTYKENMSSSRSTRMDLTDFRKTIKDSNITKNSLENLSQNTLKNKISIGSSSINNTQNYNTAAISNQFNYMPTQKDRFRNGFLLPSQRFNKSIASSEIMENVKQGHKNTENTQLNIQRSHYTHNNHKNNCPSGREEKETFSEINVRNKSTLNIDSPHKRNLGSKKNRARSPAKNAPYNKRAPSQLKNINPFKNNNELSNDFEFAKPALPIRKSKPKTQEKLIAKTAQTLIEILEPIPNKLQENIKTLQPSNLREKSNVDLTQLDRSVTTQNTDASSHPSFIKRKLFTRNENVAEKTNLTINAINSLQNNVHSLQKEKNKSRKLVTNQLYLNREVENNNNMLDFVNKKVPPDCMDVTNQTTINENKNEKDASKCNVTSISICNEDDVSDTFTDQEMCETDSNIKLTAKNKEINFKAKPIDKLVVKPVMLRDCYVMLKRLENSNTMQNKVVNQNFKLTHNNDTKNNPKNSAKTFWDTDFESDAECEKTVPRIHLTEILKKANATSDASKQNFKNTICFARSEISKKIPEVPKQSNSSFINNTVNRFNNMHKLNTTTLRVRSHRTAKKNKSCKETCASVTKFKPHNTVNNKTDNCGVAADNNVGNSKTIVLQSKKSTDVPESQLSKQTEKISTVARSTSQSKKSPKEKELTIDKKTTSPKNKRKNSESKSRSDKSNSVNIKKSKPTQNNTTATNKAKKSKRSTQDKNTQKSKTQNDKQSKKLNTPKSKHKSHTDSLNDSMRTKKNNPVSQQTHLNLNNTVKPIQNISFTSGRPIRSCRTPNQSKSIELSGSALLKNTSVSMNRSLRSRVIIY